MMNLDLNKMVTAAFEEEKLFSAIMEALEDLVDYEAIAEMYIEAHEDEIKRIALEYAEFLIE